jgi:hypothetical protein
MKPPGPTAQFTITRAFPTASLFFAVSNANLRAVQIATGIAAHILRQPIRRSSGDAVKRIPLLASFQLQTGDFAVSDPHLARELARSASIRVAGSRHGLPFCSRPDRARSTNGHRISRNVSLCIIANTDRDSQRKRNNEVIIYNSLSLPRTTRPKLQSFDLPQPAANKSR